MLIRWLALVVALVSPVAAVSEETLCAVVVIEIEQEATFERQGFEATMKITNALEGVDLEDVDVDVLFSDSAGNPVEATSDTSDADADFFITVQSLENVNAIDGSGVIASGQEAVAKWLIVPAQSAAESPEGTLYYVGAKLSYTYGGKSDTLDIAPDTIVVKPQPNLTLDYFLTREVIGDDAFTPAIEPPVPYALGLRVLNSGEGVARSFAIESAQPEIVDNELGLAVGFSILGGFVGNEPAQPSLRLDLGNIDANSAKTAQWVMQSTLSGKFVDMKADFVHAERLGGELTSLIDAVNIHPLVGKVQVSQQGRDELTDFLTHSVSGYQVFESEKTGLAGTNCASCFDVQDMTANASWSASQTSGNQSVHVIELEVTSPQPSVIKLPAPVGSAWQVARITRESNGQANDIPVKNGWISQERDEADKTHFNYYFYLFDTEAAEKYTVYFSGYSGPDQPPVFQYVPPKSVEAGGQVGFLVQASDPEGLPVEISASSMPAGASFTPMENGGFSFSWFTAPSQSGVFQAHFTANDGVKTSSLVVPIEVVGEDEGLPHEDDDGDGLSNGYEDAHGLDKNYSLDKHADLDGDGYSNWEEYLAGSDPNDANSTPLTIASLLYGGANEVAYNAYGAARSKDGRFVYVSTAKSDAPIHQYRRDIVTGSLTEVATYNRSLPSSYAKSLYLSQDGEYLYAVSNYNKSYIRTFRIDPLTGELSKLNDFVGTVDAQLYQMEPAFSPDGRYVYFVGQQNQLLEFKHDEAGHLLLNQTVDLGALTGESVNYHRGVSLTSDGSVLVVSGSSHLYALSRTIEGEVDGSALLASPYQVPDISTIYRLDHGVAQDVFYVSGSLRIAIAVSWDGTRFSAVKASGGLLGSNLLWGMNADLQLAYSRYMSRLDVYSLWNEAATVDRLGMIEHGGTDAAGNTVEFLASPSQLTVGPKGRDIYVATTGSRTVTHLYHDRFMDLDGDGVADSLDDDIDGDGVLNVQDAFPGDATESVDSDGDGYGDNVDAFPQDNTAFRDTDGDGIADSVDGDDDNDGLPDAWELEHGLNPRDPSDAALDHDNDGLTNLEESQYLTDPNSADTDNDGGLDGDELDQGTNPLVLEEDIDSDGDGCLNSWELEYGYDVYDTASPSAADTDADGLIDIEECAANANPFESDTDGDSVSDIDEVTQGTKAYVANTELLYDDAWSVGQNAYGVALSVDGRFVYLSDQTNTITAYQRDVVTGSLSPLTSYSQALHSDKPLRLDISKTGEYLYAISNSSVSYLRVYRIDPQTGGLSKVSDFQGDADAQLWMTEASAFSADGEYVYFVGENNKLLEFRHGEVGHLSLNQVIDLAALTGETSFFRALALVGNDSTLVVAGKKHLYSLARGEDGQVDGSQLVGSAFAVPTFSAGNYYIRSLHHDDINSVLYVAGYNGRAVAVSWDEGILAEAKESVYLGSRDLLHGLNPAGQVAYNIYVSNLTAYTLTDAAASLVSADVISHGGVDSLGNSVEYLASPRQIAVGPRGRDVYVATSGSRTVTHLYHDIFIDLDGDGIADSLDDDIDGDGVLNADDAFSADATESVDSDGDGYGDNVDAFSQDNTTFRDTDGDGVADSLDDDDDNDGLPDEWELEHGLNSRDPSDALLDIDGDGKSNLQEFTDQTDPLAA